MVEFGHLEQKEMLYQIKTNLRPLKIPETVIEVHWFSKNYFFPLLNDKE